MNVTRLAMAVEGCEEAEFILDGFRTGFALGIRQDYQLSYQTPKLRPATVPLLDKLADEVTKGRIIGPFVNKPLSDLFISPLYVIPKPNSPKTRMIFNLSSPLNGSVNNNIDRKFCSVQYCSVQDVGGLLSAEYPKGNAWLAKIDLSDAYRMVPIRHQDWKFLGIQVNDQFYIDRMLPMGASSSCQIFQRISDSLRQMLLKRIPTARVFNYLDDFLFVGDSKESCDFTLSAFECLCQELCVPIAHNKTVRPCQSMTFLGLGIDAAKLTMYIPAEKKTSTQKKLLEFLNTRSPRVKAWQSIAGSLNHLAQVIPAGRVYLSSVYGSMSGILSSSQHLKRRINEETRQDLLVWLALLETTPERPFKVLGTLSADFPPLYTDASTSVGYGCVWGDQWFAGQWPCGKTANIAVLELYPIVVALFLMEEGLTDILINVYTDNQALVSVINNLYSKDSSLRKLLRPLARLCLARNILVRANHVPGVDNVGPDLLSRGRLTEFRALFPRTNLLPSCTTTNQYFNLIQWK